MTLPALTTSTSRNSQSLARRRGSTAATVINGHSRPSPTQRTLFRGLESLARQAGHGAVFDAWGEALARIRDVND